MLEAPILPWARDDLFGAEVAGELLLFDPTGPACFRLNEPLRRIFELCDGVTTVAEAAARTGPAGGRAPARTALMAGLAQLTGAGLVRPARRWPVPRLAMPPECFPRLVRFDLQR